MSNKTAFIGALAAILALAGAGLEANAQHKYNNDAWHRSKYLEVTFVKSKLELQEGDEWAKRIFGIDPNDASKFGTNEMKGKGGVSIKYGRTYYIKPTPNKSLMRFGIDATFANVKWAEWKDQESWYYRDLLKDAKGKELANQKFPNGFPNEDDWEYSYPMGPYMRGNAHYMTVGVQVGPSFTINPVDLMNISMYYRFSPGASVIIDKTGEKHANFGFGAYFNWGLTISYKIISIGFDGFRGHSKLKLAEGYQLQHARVQTAAALESGSWPDGTQVLDPKTNQAVANVPFLNVVDEKGAPVPVPGQRLDPEGNNLLGEITNTKPKFYEHGFNVVLGFRFHHIKGW